MTPASFEAPPTPLYEKHSVLVPVATLPRFGLGAIQAKCMHCSCWTPHIGSQPSSLHSPASKRGAAAPARWQQSSPVTPPVYIKHPNREESSDVPCGSGGHQQSRNPALGSSRRGLGELHLSTRMNDVCLRTDFIRATPAQSFLWPRCKIAEENS